MFYFKIKLEFYKSISCVIIMITIKSSFINEISEQQLKS